MMLIRRKEVEERLSTAGDTSPNEIFIMLISNLPSVRSFARQTKRGQWSDSSSLSLSFFLSLFVLQSHRVLLLSNAIVVVVVAAAGFVYMYSHQDDEDDDLLHVFSSSSSSSFLYIEMDIRFIRSPLRWSERGEREKRVAPLPIRQFNSYAHTFLLRVSRLFFASVIFSPKWLRPARFEKKNIYYREGRKEEKKRKERISPSLSLSFVRESYGLSLLITFHFYLLSTEELFERRFNRKRTKDFNGSSPVGQEITFRSWIQSTGKRERLLIFLLPFLLDLTVKLVWSTCLSLLRFHTASNKE